MNEERYREIWEQKTNKQIEKEIKSWHTYMSKHNSAYEWHGKNITPPGELADGDKLLILKEILNGRRINGNLL